VSLNDGELTRLIQQVDSLFTKTDSGLLVSPAATPLVNSIITSGRRMGKTTLARKWVEDYQESIASKPMSHAEFTQEYLCEPVSTSASATTAPPWASKSAEEILADMTAVGAMLGKPPAKPNMFDALTASASDIVKLTEEQHMTMNTKEEAAKHLAEQINKLIAASIRPGPFKLSGPAQLTIKTRQSQYKKKSFLGDETMSLTSVYGGKKEVIAVFKNTLPVDYSYIEIPLSDAATQLVGFQDYLKQLGVADIDTIVAGIEQHKTQAAVAEHNALLEDPEFASW
jgi:hypothetical protein